MSKNHLIVIYILLAILAFFTFSQKNGNSTDLDDIKNRVTKVEFFQEATRIRDNVIGFKNVNGVLANDAARSRNCIESSDLLTEWSEDIKKLGLQYQVYMSGNQDAKDYFNSISKANDEISADCNKLTAK